MPFKRPITVKPEYRRHQFGGTLGGPLARDRTFFFVDYQGQRQAIGRTVISTVPTLLQRQGIFTESIAGRVPVVYDPATTVGSVRTPFPNNTIPSGRFDTVAAGLLQRYPLPTVAGTANNYRRTENEIDDQDQWDARIDHRFSPRDQVFGRLLVLQRPFPAGDAAPRRQRRDDRDARPAGHDRLGVRVQLPAHVLGRPC